MIDLLELNLDGWLSYDQVTLRLDQPGVTLIRGSIGAGKSAIFEAVFYLLFGKTLRKKQSVTHLENRVLNKGYDISLTFQIDKDMYIIQEVRGRKNSGLYFFVNGTRLAGKTDVETRTLIQKRLNITSDEFKSIFLIGQKQAQELVEGTPEARAKLLVSIFGLYRYDDLIAVCNNEVKTLTLSKTHYKENIAVYDDNIRNLEESINAAKVPSKEELARLTTEADALTTTIANINSKLDKLHIIAEDSQKQIGNFVAVEKQQEKIALLTQEVEEAQQKLSSEDWPEKSVVELRRLLEDSNEKRFSAIHTRNAEQYKLNDAESANNICPVSKLECPVNIPIKHADDIIRCCTEKIGKEQKDIDKLDKLVVSTTRKIERAEEKKILHESIAEKEKILNTITVPADAADIATAEQNLERAHDAIQGWTQKKEKLDTKLAEIELKIGVGEKNKSLLTSLRENIVTQRGKQKKLIDKLNDASDEALLYAAAQAVFKRAKLYKIDLIIDLINAYMNEILIQISYGVYHAQFVSQQEASSSVRILDRLGIDVYDGFKTIPIELCSGGQATEVGLAILLAVWRAASTLSNKCMSSLWLDEVFGPLDEQTVQRVFETVVDIANQLGAKNVKVISHRALYSSMLASVWDVKLVDGISEVTVH